MKQVIVSVANVVEMLSKGDSLYGESIVFTGFRDKTFESLIKSNGGNVGSSVSRKTTLLVMKNMDSNSGKARKARNNGIDVIGREKFPKWLKKKGVKV